MRWSSVQCRASDQSDQFPRVCPTLIWTESIRRVWESRREWNAEVGQSAAEPVTTGDRIYLVHPRENPRWTSWEWCSINGYIAANSKVDVALEAALCQERSEPNSIKRVTSSRTTDAIFSERNSLSKHDGLLLSGDSARRWQNGTAWWMRESLMDDSLLIYRTVQRESMSMIHRVARNLRGNKKFL